MRLRDFLKIFELLAGLRFGPQLFEFNAVVIPIEFLTQIADPPDQVALTHFSEWKALSALENHFDHVARLCRFDAGKSLFVGSSVIAATKVKIHERLVNLHSVFYEGDFQFFAMQPAA